MVWAIMLVFWWGRIWRKLFDVVLGYLVCLFVCFIYPLQPFGYVRLSAIYE